MRKQKIRLVRHAALPLGGALALLAATAPTDAHAEGARNHLRDVRAVKLTEPGAIEVQAEATLAPTYHVRLDGKTLLVDLDDADVVGAPSAVANPGGLLGGVLMQAFSSGGKSSARLTIHLASTAGYRVHVEGTTLKVLLVPAKETGLYEGPIGAVGGTPPPVVHPAAAKEGDSGEASLSDVRFEIDHEKPRLVVVLSRPADSTTRVTASGQLRLELKKVRVPDALVRALDVTAYKTDVQRVSTFHDADTGSAIIEIERTGDSQGSLAVDGNKLIWSFPPKSTTFPSPIQNGRAATASRTKTAFREEGPDPGPQPTTNIHDGEIHVETVGAEARGFTSTVAAQVGGDRPRFNGRRIDLDLKDADIHNILRLLADVGRVNIVTADDVAGNITIRMRNVPWDQALDVVLQAKGLGMVRQGNLIRVAPLAQLQKERELKLAQQRAELDLAPLETRLIPVSYAQADEIQARAKDFLSPRGSLAVDARTNVLIARDVAGNLNHIEELVRSLDTQTPQVLVEARIVEATSQYARDIGIQWGGDVTFSPATGNPTGVAFPSSVGVAGGNYDNNTPTAGLSPTQRNLANPNFAVNLPATTGTGQGGALGLAFGSIDNTINLGVRLSAAESTGMLRIVSSPRILTLDNREARILQGTLIPFAQVSAQGVQTTFQEAKLQLLVKPHVTADGSVSMHVKINRDEPDFNQTSARGDPTILKREAETDLLVLDGHTAVIGGIFTRNTGRNLNQVPFFGDIPILGVLFQRRRASDTRNELVIFLTPRIVNRAEALGR